MRYRLRQTSLENLSSAYIPYSQDLIERAEAARTRFKELQQQVRDTVKVNTDLRTSAGKNTEWRMALASLSSLSGQENAPEDKQ